MKNNNITSSSTSLNLIDYVVFKRIRTCAKRMNILIKILLTAFFGGQIGTGLTTTSAVDDLNR